MEKLKVICERCGKTVERYPSECLKHIYCSLECRKNREKVICEYCHKEFEVRKSKLGISKRLFCSRSCKDKWQTQGLIGENNPFYKKSHNKITKEKISKTKKQQNLRGKRNKNWNPSITDEERLIKRNYYEYGEWVSKVFARDNYTCQVTKKRGGDLIAHHLNGYDWDKDHRIDINNGITLSKKVHREFHTIYGYGKNTKEQFDEFVRNYNKTNI